MKYSLVFLFLSLTACSFTPMLQTNEADIDKGVKLVVENINKDGNSYTVQMMRQRLRCALSNLQLDNQYKVYIRLNEETGNLAYATDATAMRAMMRFTAQIIISYQGQTLYETKLASVTSYSQNANDEFINQSAAQGAQERLIEGLSIDISREVQRFAKDQEQERASNV